MTGSTTTRRALAVLALLIGVTAGCYGTGGHGPPTTTSSSSSSSSSSTAPPPPAVLVVTVTPSPIHLSCDGSSCQGTGTVTVTNNGGPTTGPMVLSSNAWPPSQGTCGPILGAGLTCVGSIDVSTVDPSNQGGGGVNVGGTVTATAGGVTSSGGAFTAST